MRHNYTQPQSPQTYTRVLSFFRGVDFTNNPLNVDPTRMPYACNVISDEAGILHKRPPWEAWESSYSLSSPPQIVHGVYPFVPAAIPASSYSYTTNKFLLVHAKETLYIYDRDSSENSLGMLMMADAPSSGFQHKDSFYLLDGTNYQCLYEDDATSAWAVKHVREIATAPETQIAGYYYAEEYTEINESTNEGETKHKYTWTFGDKGERNLLTARRINTFCGDGIHKTFYLDAPNFKVYKVEMYSPTGGASSTEGIVTAVSGTSNIRDDHSMNGAIIGHATGGQTFTVTGKHNTWYQIIYNDRTAWINQSRVTYTPATQGATATEDTEWVEMTSGFTVSEDSTKKCTKIVFDSTPPIHPRGNGLPNIRVTGAITEIATKTFTLDAYSSSVSIASSDLMTALISVKKNGTELSNSAYTVTDYSGGTTITLSSAEEGDEIEVVYRRESFKDNDLIEHCNKYGKFGSYNTDRYFFTGNPNYPNRDWYSEPDDPTCVLENSYTDIGSSSTGIAGYLNYQGDMLIIKYDSPGECLFRRTADTDGDLTIFPVKAYTGRGAVSAKAMANIKGDCVYLSPEGVFGFVSSELGTKYAIQDRSFLINKMLKAENLEDAEMGVWGDLLLITFTNGHCYVADTTQMTAPTTTSQAGYEWFYWEGVPAKNMVYYPGVERFYFSEAVYNSQGVATYSAMCKFTPESTTFQDKPFTAGSYRPIEAAMTTFCDQLDEPARYKYIEQRGAIIQVSPLTQELRMALIVDGVRIADHRYVDIERQDPHDSDLEVVKASIPTIPYHTFNHRINRFRYIQFTFRNSDPATDAFGLLSIEYQYRYGRYIL